MAEAFNSLFKAELVRNKGPWKSIDDLEIAVAECIDWFNHRRLHGELGLIPPAEYGANHPHHNPALTTIGASVPGLVSDGVPINDVAKVMGHEQTSTTLDRYAHSTKDRDRRVLAAFDAFSLPGRGTYPRRQDRPLRGGAMTCGDGCRGGGVAVSWLRTWET